MFIEAVYRDKTVISLSLLAEMMVFKTPKAVVDGIIPDAGHKYGVGVFQEFVTRGNPDEWDVGHTGGDLGNAAEAYYFPNQDITMCLLVNYGTNSERALTDIYWTLQHKIVEGLMN